MGNRLTIYPQPILFDHIDELTGKEVDIVMLNGRTLHVIILHVQDTIIFVRDLLHRKHKIPLDEVEEVVFGYPSSF